MKIADLVETLRDSWMFFHQAGECRDWATYKQFLLDAVDGQESKSAYSMTARLSREIESWFRTWTRRQVVGCHEQPVHDEVAEYWLWVRFVAELDQAIAEVGDRL